MISFLKWLRQFNLFSGGFGVNNCGHSEDASVKCSGPNQSKRCVSKCGDGFYDHKGTCKRCLSKCSSCHDRPDLCSRCKKPYFLQFTDCVLQCPLGKYGNTKTRKCDSCYKSCQTCYNGDRNDHCKSCPEGLFLSKF